MSSSTVLAAAAAAHQPGKAPVLFGTSPADLVAFSRSAKLYFRTKKIIEDPIKIEFLAAGLQHFPDLHNWYLSNADELEEGSYEGFLAELQRRALPRDFVWEEKGRIRTSRQGGEDFEDWLDDMRTSQLALTEKVLGTREFVEALLYGMDVELSAVLRRGQALKGTGFHVDDLATAAFTTSAIYPAPAIDYQRFDLEARDEWARIAARRHSNATQLKSLSKRVGSLSLSSTKPAPPARGARPPPTTAANVAPARDGAARPAPLTERERDWLAANNGCFKCRKVNVNHRSAECHEWAPAGFVVAVPEGWSRSSQPPSSSSSRGPKVGVAAIHALSDESDIELPLSLAEGSDSEDDWCAFPPLSLWVGAGRRGCATLALADSGASVSLISQRLVQALGLERAKLSKPRRAVLALKEEGCNEVVSTITEFVRVPLQLENGAWSAGITTLLVADVQEPYDVILGNPFLARHRIAVVPGDSPQLLKQQDGMDPIDLFDEPYGPPTLEAVLQDNPEAMRQVLVDELARACAVRLEQSVSDEVTEQDDMRQRARRVLSEFEDLFPASLPPLTADMLARCTTRHRIRLSDNSRVHNQRGFSIPRKWRESWKRMLEEHLAAGRLRPSTSPYASAAFVVPKRDPTADPRWVNDYRSLNANTIKDRTPLPLPDVVLADAARAKIWGKIDMTNAFFQTPMHEDDIEKTAIKTPWGLFEWTVMPQGLCNAPATHQARVNEALRHLIGVCCEAFVDDVIIYSDTIEQHEENCRAVLSALRSAGLFCSAKKTDLFTTHTEFLGHVISRAGLQADKSKIEKVLNWPRPKTVSQVRGFLGVVQYLRKFIPQLAEHTAVLTPLTRKGLTRIEELWTKREERAFEAIKRIVTSLPVLKPLDQDSGVPIWVMTDASKVGVGAVLLQGEDWRTASPCGFFSRQYIAAERNYPTHEQELLAVVAALKAWRVDLLGVHFRVLTDHDTLKHFGTQPTLSKRQARWTETLADYDYELSYIPGKQNAVADALSRFSFAEGEGRVAVCGISEASISSAVTKRIRDKYAEDSFVQQVLQNLESSSSFAWKDELLYFEGDRIVVPEDKELREALMHDAHDALGHLGPRKSLSSLSLSFYWPRMAKHVERYVASCDGCQRHKARTTLSTGKLHPLPVPPRPFTDVALDFVGPLPLSEGHDMLLTVTDRLTGYTRLIPSNQKDGARETAERFFRGWATLFGLPQRIVSDRDKLFTGKFWRSLHSRLDVQLQMSTSFHPETDGRSERTNKTAIQIARQYVSREQRDWVATLSLAEYAINSAINDSTGRSPFELVLGYRPVVHPSPSSPFKEADSSEVAEWLEDRASKLRIVRDELAAAKVRQAAHANKKRGPEVVHAVGDLVMVDTRGRRARFKSRRGDGRSAKLFPRWDGPFEVLEATPATSRYRLALPEGDKAHPVFHASKLKRYVRNDPDVHPRRKPARPEPIDVDGEEEFFVEAIVDEKGSGAGRRFLVKWEGYPSSENSWEPLRHVKDTAALDAWERRGGPS